MDELFLFNKKGNSLLELSSWIIMAKIIKMMDLLKKEGIELGKVYTDKTMPPFKITEMKVNNSFQKIY